MESFPNPISSSEKSVVNAERALHILTKGLSQEEAKDARGLQGPWGGSVLERVSTFRQQYRGPEQLSEAIRAIAGTEDEHALDVALKAVLDASGASTDSPKERDQVMDAQAVLAAVHEEEKNNPTFAKRIEGKKYSAAEVHLARMDMRYS